MLARSVFVFLAGLLALWCASPALAQVNPYLPPTASEGAPAMPVPRGADDWLKAKPFFCSRQDRDRAIEQLEAQLRTVEGLANSARQYRQAMQQRVDQEYRDMQQAKYDQDKPALDWFRQNRLDRMTNEDPARAEDEVEKARRAPVIDCKDRGAIAGQRPAVIPFSVPELPPCYNDRAHLRALNAAADRALAAFDRKEETYYRYFIAVEDLKNSTDADISRPAQAEYDSAEVAALRRDLNSSRTRLSEYLRALENLKPCPADGGNSQPPPNSKPVSAEADNSISWPDDPFDARILELHNEARAEVGAPPLRWSAELKLSAGAWAGHLAEIGRLEHAPREGRGVERENLQQGLPGWDADDFMMPWLGEEADFMPGEFPDVSRTWMPDNVLHYAQVIWFGTVSIGCAKSSGHGFEWFVCRYSPGGNRPGEWVGARVGEQVRPAAPASEGWAVSMALFDWGSDAISPQTARALDRAAEDYHLTGDAEVEIYGAGPDTDVIQLTTRRVESVRGYLSGRGILDDGFGPGKIDIDIPALGNEPVLPVGFDTNRATLTEGGYAFLDAAIDRYRQTGSATIEIHSSTQENAGSSLETDRLAAVHDYLTNHGVPVDAINTGKVAITFSNEPLFTPLPAGPPPLLPPPPPPP